MRIGILSDTHDQMAATLHAVQVLQREGAEALVHCGDLTSAPIVMACGVLPLYFCFGNHDADNVPHLLKAAAVANAVCLQWGGEIQLAGKRIAVGHGHMGLRDLLAARPDYLLHGHSHEPADQFDGATRRISPGALENAAASTVALLDLHSDELRILALPVMARRESSARGV